MKLKPCPQCGNEDIEFYDCGYSSFNCGYYKCKKCEFKVKWTYASGGNLSPGIKNVWDQEANDYPIRLKALAKLTEEEKRVLGWPSKREYDI